MIVQKGNRQYRIRDAEYPRYKSMGFYHVGKGLDDADLSPGAAQEQAAQGDNGLRGMTVEELREYAREHDIALGNASSVNGIAKKIEEALEKRDTIETDASPTPTLVSSTEGAPKMGGGEK